MILISGLFLRVTGAPYKKDYYDDRENQNLSNDEEMTWYTDLQTQDFPHSWFSDKY